MIYKDSMCAYLGYDKNKSAPLTTWLYMGMLEGDRGNGWFHPVVEEGFNTGKMKEADKRYKKGMQERIDFFLHNPYQMLVFYHKKSVSAWTDTTYQSMWYNYDIETLNEKTGDLIHSKKYILLQSIGKGLVLSMIGVILWYLWKRKTDISPEMILLLLIFIGGFTFHTLWEIKSRYVFPYILMLIPLSSAVLTSIESNKKIQKNSI